MANASALLLQSPWTYPLRTYTRCESYVIPLGASNFSTTCLQGVLPNMISFMLVPQVAFSRTTSTLSAVHSGFLDTTAPSISGCYLTIGSERWPRNSSLLLSNVSYVNAAGYPNVQGSPKFTYELYKECCPTDQPFLSYEQWLEKHQVFALSLTPDGSFPPSHSTDLSATGAIQIVFQFTTGVLQNFVLIIMANNCASLSIDSGRSIMRNGY